MICPKCGEEFRLAWLSGDPPEPYGDVCGCPDEDYAMAKQEKRAEMMDNNWYHMTDRWS
jgi:hypothetical protein